MNFMVQASGEYWGTEQLKLQKKKKKSKYYFMGLDVQIEKETLQ